MDHYAVVVVGCGPAGLMAAKILAEKKVNVLALDKKQEIGVPVRCGEGLGMGWFNRLGLTPNPAWAVQPIEGAALWSPKGKKISIRFGKTSGYVLERRMFEKYLAREAALAGAKIIVKHHVTSCERKNGKVELTIKSLGEESKISANIVIAADGVDSLTARRLGLNTVNKLIDIDSGFQYEMAGIDFEDPDLISLFFGTQIAPRGYCLTPESEVVAKNSVKTIAETVEGDEVLTMNGWKSVEATSERFYDGEIFDITPAMVNKKVGLTPEHEVFTWNKKTGFAWKKTKELIQGTRRKHGMGDYLVFPGIETKIREDKIDVSRYFKGIEKNGKIFPVGRNQSGVRFAYKHGIKKELELTKKLLQLMGFFVAEGNTNSNGIILSNTNKKNISVMQRYGKKCFGFEGTIWTPKTKNYKKCYQLHFASVIVKKMFAEMFGVGCKNKKIPPFVFGLSEEKKRAFLKGYFDGDGGIEESTEGYDVMSFATSSKHLANDLWILLASMKIVAFVGKNKTKNSFKIKIRGKQLEKLKTLRGKLRHGSVKNRGFRIIENKICLGIREIRKRNYSGNVYDIQTNGSFCVPFAVHNCWIFPKGNHEANVGIGIGGYCEGKAKDYLDKWIATMPGLSKGSMIHYNSGAIPVGGFLENMVADNLLVCGDAAHQVDPIHGGGIGISMEAATIAAEVAAEAIAKKDYSAKFLSKYNTQWHEKRGNQLKKRLKARHLMEKLDDSEFEAIAENLSGEQILELGGGEVTEKAKFMAKLIIKKPSIGKKMLESLAK